MKASTLIVCVGGLLFAALLNLHFAAAAEAVQTGEGPVRGTTENEVTSYLGIPFAAAPVGDLRWRAPRAHSPWRAVLHADHYGSDCIQNGDPRPTSEDCLYLNIWVPEHPSVRKGEHLGQLPVMVFIHGGGFNSGSGAEPWYRGASLARRGVVLVTFNYRLGKLGFFALPALARENPAGPLGNYQVMDQIAALEWVKRNIARFGGDPDNVTLFGESSGGTSVTILMASPAARGLFQKAIVESGVRKFRMETLAEAEADGKSAAAGWGVRDNDAAALRGVPAAVVLGKARLGFGGAGPMIDGAIIRENPLAAFRDGHVPRIPLILGTNSDEAGDFPGLVHGLSKRLSSVWPKVLTLYDGYGTHETPMIEAELLTDILTAGPTRMVAREAARDGLPTYLYQFDFLRPSERGRYPGPIHTDELYAVFGTMNVAEQPVTADMRRITDEVQSRWVEFERTGRPTADSSAWPATGSRDDEVLVFTQDGPPVVRRNLRKDRIDFANTLPLPTALTRRTAGHTGNR
ncbi:MAG: carboxylesterase/lipase family protein [Acetobacteraceae bacterium]